MAKSNTKLAINENLFSISAIEKFEELIEKEQDAGNFAPVFLYDNKGRFKGVNALPWSVAAIKLLAKIRQPKDEKNDRDNRNSDEEK